MKNGKLQVAVVGCGGIANQKHFPALTSQSDKCEIVAFCDIIEERAKAGAEKFGTPDAKVYTDYNEMMNDEAIDVVHVCTPNNSHCPVTVAAFHAGKHVLCEKPMAATTEDAQKMMDAWKKSGKKFTIGYQNRFRTDARALKSCLLYTSILRACIQYHKHVLCEKPICDTLEAGSAFFRLVKEHPEIKVLVGHILRHNKTYQRAAEMIQTGALGRPVIFRMEQNHHTMNWERYLSMLREVSPLLDCGVHYADIIQWFTGAKVIDIQATGVRSEKDVPVGNYNYGLVTMRMSDGSVGYYEAGYSNTCLLYTSGRERKYIDSVSSGERKRKSPNQRACMLGFGLHTLQMRLAERSWKDRPERVKAP